MQCVGMSTITFHYHCVGTAINASSYYHTSAIPKCPYMSEYHLTTDTRSTTADESLAIVQYDS